MLTVKLTNFGAKIQMSGKVKYKKYKKWRDYENLNFPHF